MSRNSVIFVVKVIIFCKGGTDPIVARVQGPVPPFFLRLCQTFAMPKTGVC